MILIVLGSRLHCARTVIEGEKPAVSNKTKRMSRELCFTIMIINYLFLPLPPPTHTHTHTHTLSLSLFRLPPSPFHSFSLQLKLLRSKNKSTVIGFSRMQSAEDVARRQARTSRLIRTTYSSHFGMHPRRCFQQHLMEPEDRIQANSVIHSGDKTIRQNTSHGHNPEQ